MWHNTSAGHILTANSCRHCNKTRDPIHSWVKECHKPEHNIEPILQAQTDHSHGHLLQASALLVQVDCLCTAVALTSCHKHHTTPRQQQHPHTEQHDKKCRKGIQVLLNQTGMRALRWQHQSRITSSVLSAPPSTALAHFHSIRNDRSSIMQQNFEAS
jgi:hypothetical protein